MRIKTTAAVVAIALAGVIAFSVIGQDEPLPAVIPKASPTLGTIPLAAPTIVLAAEPIREYRPPTLLDAARNNDYITFDALYAAAKKRGEDVSPYDALHELWTYSVTDPIGAFYGQELYERLSRAYPGYAAYIDEFRVIDSRGNTFYPTSETRAFLLDRAVEGRPAPRVQVAERKARPVERRPRPAAEPETSSRKLPAAEAAAAPQVPAPVAIPAPTNPNPTATRGILLMIIGLIGVGLLALVLRTPREEPMTVMQHPVNNVEPLRKAPAPKPPDEPRASGTATG